jgi:porin
MKVATILALCATAAAWPSVAAEDTSPTPPFLATTLRETVDVFDNARGGISTGSVALNKFQLAATVNGAAFGADGLQLHGQIFATNGPQLSGRVGDLQTVSNIEAPRTVRLFEAWAQQSFGNDGAGGGAVRIGLLDLNADFDSIGTAGFMVNSSHGIGPDVSRSGLAGPSIFPVSALGLQADWTPSDKWAVHGGLFDGVAGDPAHQSSFVRIRLAGTDGVLGIGQADYQPAKDVQISFGVWHYTSHFAEIDQAGQTLSGSSGAFAFVEGPLPYAGLKGWLRAGVADGRVQTVSGYFGAGLVAPSPFPGRGDDNIGLAVATAQIGEASRKVFRLPGAETTFEATYRFKVLDSIGLQPDVQYVIHPASAPSLPNALVAGLRISVSLQHPRHVEPKSSGEPDSPPEAPAAPSTDPAPAASSDK